MSEPKSFASLCPTLLARKGGARPAMRTQMNAMPEAERLAANHLDDLGWNDMGEDHSAEVLSLTPPPTNREAANRKAEDQTAELAKPEVRRQQESIATQIAGPVPARHASTKRAPAKPRRSALEDGRRAAFTLRVDGDRHLKLRLACTIHNRSAQQIVTEALDKLLADMPDLEVLASQVKRK